jgi:pimeloyl-ACP methyl ester carboxylesterase
VVLLTAGLGMPMRRMLVPALILAANGFTVARFDPRNSVGASDGELAEFTLTDLADDVLDVAGWVVDHLGVEQVATLTASLTGRAALRSAALQPDLFSVVGTVACVVAVQSTLTRVKGEDLVAKWRTGELTDPDELDDLLDYRIKLNAVRSIVDDGWARLESAREDVRQAAGVHFVNLHGDRDPWVAQDEVEHVFGAEPNATLVVLRNAVHELNFASATVAMRQLVSAYRARLGGDRIQPADVVIPSFEDYVECNKSDRILTARLPSLDPDR